MGNSSWLKHLSPEIVKDCFGSKLSSYLIILEAWRRGLTVILQDHKLNIYTICSEKQSISFDISRIGKTPQETIEICINKSRTKEFLKNANINCPEGEYFSETVHDESIIQFVKFFGFPVVIKPVDGSLGKGVICDIKREKDLKEYLKYVREELQKPNIIVERYVNGEEHRVYVLGDKVVAVVKRIPANICGNGKDNIRKLIQEKNKIRQNNPHLSKGLIKVDKEVLDNLSSLGYTLESIPKEGEVIYLRKKSNASSGGDTIDVTDDFPDKFKKIAIEAAKAIPGLYHCGIDLLVNYDDDIATVLEINSRANIGIHVYPLIGEGRDIASYILDEFMPESKGNSSNLVNKKLVFNINKLLSCLKEGSASSITISPLPTQKLNSYKYVIRGEVQGVGLRKWIKNKALKLNLFGSVKNLKNGNVLLILSGLPSHLMEFENILNNTNKFKISDIKKTKYNKVIRMGFDIL